MKIETTPQTSERQDFQAVRRCDHVIVETTDQPIPEETEAEAELSSRIFQDGNGRGLMKFCRELSKVLIRRYMVENDVTALRKRVCASLIVTLECSEPQAQCLVDLSLELIHAKLHGKYRRSNVELSYLIAMATGAVKDVASN